MLIYERIEMKHSDFVHLHNHTEYSLLDGACHILDDSGKPGTFLQQAEKFKMPALAITDHGNMFGAIEFYQACMKIGIKPIIGSEVYIAPQSRLNKEASGIAKAAYHLTLLVKNEIGYKNLIRLTSIGYLEGFYYRPRIDKEVLKQYNEGLIGLSGCMKGEIPQLILQGNIDAARELIGVYQDIFGKDNFYLELHDHGIEGQKKIIENLLLLAKQCDAPMVATNDTHYLLKEDAESHEVLLGIGTGKTIDDPTRMRFSTEEFYFKSPQEMKELFSYVPEAIRNTIEITEKCNLELEFGRIYLPHYDVPSGFSPNSYLEKLCREGAKSRYGQISSQIEQRLQYELDVVKQMNYSAYFLIVWDFIRYAKQRNIPVGPGRGSGAGSVVAYTLGITNIDPLKYGLLFERFLNPKRVSMPDLDIDFSDEGREEIINYVKNKYGEKNVAQIITFGSMQARLVIRDVGRVLNIPLTQVDKIAKQIPFGEGIYSALKKVEGLKKLANENHDIARLIKISSKLEGLKRHTGVHAAGIVISKDDMTNYVPFARGAKNVITTQYEGNSLVKLGLLKMDFLGLRTLTVIQKAINLIKENNKNEKIQTEEDFPLNDEKTYQLLCRAESSGVFQLESSGMKDLLRKIAPTEFFDLIALLALYRPGPIGSGMLDEFIKVVITYDHPLLEPILKETYGIVVYQEQVMRIAQDLAGFSLGRADLLRRAMGKKDLDEMEKQRTEFMKGAQQKGIKTKTANKIFNTMSKFGAYGFNKSHSAAYALISYQTAYLKANYPLEYMTALLNSEINNTDKMVQYINECQAMKIPIFPPDVQTSFHNFVFEKEGIRFGLLGIKNVGEGAISSLVEARKKKGFFESFYDFCYRVDLHHTNKQVIKSMIKAGAFDSLGVSRAQLMQKMDEILNKAISRQKDKMIGQTSMFEMIDEEKEAEEKSKKKLAEKKEEWPGNKLLAYEKEVLGFYFSGHPLKAYVREIEKYSTHTISQLHEQENINGDSISVGGIITHIKRITTRKNELMAVCILEDLEGKIEVVIFPRNYNDGIIRYLKIDEIVIVKGKVDGREERSKILADEIMPLLLIRQKKIKSLCIKMGSDVFNKEEILHSLKKIMEQNEGNCPVIFDLAIPEKKNVMINSMSRILPSEEVIVEIEKIFGEKSVEIKIEK
jgi:DNA polymerase-3 subunit alpha